MAQDATATVPPEPVPAARTRVLFVCWGYSIHAWRRVQLFIDDPRFEVAVVSTHDYQFANARFYPLRAARQAASEAPAPAARPVAAWLSTETRERLAQLRNFVLLPLELWRSAQDLGVLRVAARDFRPAVVFLQTLQYPCYLAYLLPRHLPLMVTFWNGDVTYFARWTGLEMLAKKQLVRYGLQRVDFITVNSRTALDACLSLGAPAEKIELIRYPAADIAMFARRDHGEARARLGISAARVVLCPRGLGRFFNSDVIVDAMPAVLARYPDTLFVFVSGIGGPAEWARHLEQGRRLGVADRMRWDGHVEWDMMPWYYSVADVMLSIKTADSCPNCMLEAMAAEAPVVMSDTSQNREWIDDGSNGFLVEPRDPALVAQRVLQLLEDGDLGDAFRQRSLERVRTHGNARINVPRIRDLVLKIADPSGT